MTPDFLAVGRIGRPHGVQGELQVDPLTDFPERFAPGSILYIGPERGQQPVPARVLSSRPHKSRWLLRFEGIEDRDTAMRWTGLYAYVPIDEAHPLDEDSYYSYQLEGLEVVTDAGRELGRVSGVLETGAADVLVVRGPYGGEILLPMIDQVIAEIDLEAGRITVTPLPGLIDED